MSLTLFRLRAKVDRQIMLLFVVSYSEHLIFPALLIFYIFKLQLISGALISFQLRSKWGYRIKWAFEKLAISDNEKSNFL